MKNQACVPCAKRKVRCDREEPCSNCKRRKQDHCRYSDTPPVDRIKQLEFLVRNLGGDPDELEHGPAEVTTPPSVTNRNHQATQNVNARPSNHDTPRGVIVEEDGEHLYLETRTWHSLDQRGLKQRNSNMGVYIGENTSRKPVLARTSSIALQHIIHGDASIDFSTKHPDRRQVIELWDTFHLSVKPFHKIDFDWYLDEIASAASTTHGVRNFSPQQHALVFALYFVTTDCFSERSCMELFHESKSSKLSEFQMLCEEALARSDFLGASDLLTIQAFILYITGGLDKMSTRSLSSLMGLVIRNAERLGIHRDGSFLNLPPIETERRRRVWWQLMHVEMILAVKSGYGPLTLTSGWDTKMPLNIEDSDINASMEQFPEERSGLTGMSLCLWICWVLNEQLSLHRSDGSRPGIYWSSDSQMPKRSKEDMIERLEKGLNNKFLQYCDPIRPLDSLLQHLARSFIWGMRRLTLHSVTLGPNADPAQQGKLEKDLLDVCVRCLEYDVAMHSNPLHQHFKWRLPEYFPWTALAYVIVEVCRHYVPRNERLWTLLDELYASNTSLSNISEDNRRAYAAELILAAWKAREKYFLEQCAQTTGINGLSWTPSLIPKLESLLAAAQVNGVYFSGSQDNVRERAWGSNIHEIRQTPRTIRRQTLSNTNTTLYPSEEANFEYFDLSTITDPVLSDIDWSFWASLQ